MCDGWWVFEGPAPELHHAELDSASLSSGSIANTEKSGDQSRQSTYYYVASRLGMVHCASTKHNSVSFRRITIADAVVDNNLKSVSTFLTRSRAIQLSSQWLHISIKYLTRRLTISSSVSSSCVHDPPRQLNVPSGGGVCGPPRSPHWVGLINSTPYRPQDLLWPYASPKTRPSPSSSSKLARQICRTPLFVCPHSPLHHLYYSVTHSKYRRLWQPLRKTAV